MLSYTSLTEPSIATQWSSTQATSLGISLRMPTPTTIRTEALTSLNTAIRGTSPLWMPQRPEQTFRY